MAFCDMIQETTPWIKLEFIAVLQSCFTFVMILYFSTLFHFAYFKRLWFNPTF
jgi:hypothetical protein